jgi:acetyl esterase
VDIEDLSAARVPVRIVRPQGVTGPRPAILHIHGAGWVFGNRDTYDRLVRELAHGVGTTATASAAR